jgi:hypothetical protein
VRYRLKRRRHDWIWLASVAIIILGFGSIAGVAFAFPIADIVDDHKCRIGVPTKVTVPLITYDIMINAALTGVFVAMLRPLLRFQEQQKAPDIHLDTEHDNSRPETHKFQIHAHAPSTESEIELTASTSHSTPRSDTHPSVNSLKKLVYRSLTGAVAITVPTVINLGLLFRWKGHEQGWLCFTLCTLDGNPNIFSTLRTYLTLHSYLERRCAALSHRGS